MLVGMNSLEKSRFYNKELLLALGLRRHRGVVAGGCREGYSIRELVIPGPNRKVEGRRSKASRAHLCFERCLRHQAFERMGACHGLRSASPQLDAALRR